MVSPKVSIWGRHTVVSMGREGKKEGGRRRERGRKGGRGEEGKIAEKYISKSVAIRNIPTWAIRILWAWFKKINLFSFEDAFLNFSAFVKSSIKMRLLARVNQDLGERNSLPSSKLIISYWEKRTLCFPVHWWALAMVPGTLALGLRIPSFRFNWDFP